MKKLAVLFVLLVILLAAGAAVYVLFFQESKERAIDEHAIAIEYGDADRFYHDNPHEFDKASARFQQLIFEYPSSSWAPKAETRILEINADKAALIDATWSALCDEADTLVKSDSFEVAIAFLNDYSGPFYEDMKNRIKGRVLGYYRRIKALEEAEEELTKSAGIALNQLIQDVAKNLYEYHFKAAQELLSEAPNNPIYEPISEAMMTFCERSTPIAWMPDQICSLILLKQQTSEFVTVPLKAGTKKLKILEVNDTHVEAERVIMIDGREAGSTPDSFSFEDLSIKGQAYFLGKDKGEPYQVMRALILVQAKQYEKAMNYLSGIESQLAEALRELLRESSAAINKPVTPSFEPVFEPDDDNVLIVL